MRRNLQMGIWEKDSLEFILLGCPDKKRFDVEKCRVYITGFMTIKNIIIKMSGGLIYFSHQEVN